MKIIVTGASGFLGKNYLLSTNPNDEVFAVYNNSADFLSFLHDKELSWVRPLKVNLEEPESISKSMTKGEKFDKCIYFAANGDPAVSVTKVGFDLRSNAVALVNLLEHIQAGRVVFFSSGAVYDGVGGGVSYESHKSVSPHLPYAVSKLASELYIHFFQTKGYIDSYANVRFFGAFGPYEPERKIYTKLINSFAFQKSIQFSIRGNGKNFIDAMYIDDAVRAVKILENSNESLGLDLYSGQKKSISELVTVVANFFGIEPEI
ncbi:MAG TPA: NAD(P)-dependent oxidoreductase, partial [Leptospiraceae bacterium]|nr:NAD(P)-dependent oxidoreductase [Leptospiraceae bacterium]